MSTVVSVAGQRIKFSDGAEWDVPWIITPRMDEGVLFLQLDASKRIVHLGRGVDRAKLRLCVNILAVDKWRLDGRVGKPALVEEIP